MSLAVRLRHRLGEFGLDVAFDAPQGITVLFGRSGAGKTSVVNAVAGLLRPDEALIRLNGEVLVDTGSGQFVPTHRRRLGMVFQEGRLFPHLSVRQNLLYGRRGRESGPASAGLNSVIEMLDIGPLLGRRPATLSGGEKQRVAIGRALLAEPQLILADEPLTALDEARKAEILPYFERLRDEVSVPILYVSHSVAEVARLATTVVALAGGRVSGQGPVADMLGDPAFTPTGSRAAGAFLPARVVAHHADGLSELDAGGIALFLPRVAYPPGSALRVRIPAHEVLLARGVPDGLSALNVLPGVIEVIRSGEGPGALVSVRTEAGIVLARVTQRSVTALGLRPGVRCHAIVKALGIAPDDVGSGPTG